MNVPKMTSDEIIITIKMLRSQVRQCEKGIVALIRRIENLEKEPQK